MKMKLPYHDSKLRQECRRSIGTILHAESQAAELREAQAALERLLCMLGTIHDGRTRDENPNIVGCSVEEQQEHFQMPTRR